MSSAWNFYNDTMMMAMNFWVGASFVNDETKEQLEQWMQTQSPDKLKKFKQSLPAARKQMGAVFKDKIGVVMVSFMQ
jgi:hypothetical protein